MSLWPRFITTSSPNEYTHMCTISSIIFLLVLPSLKYTRKFQSFTFLKRKHCSMLSCTGGKCVPILCSGLVLQNLLIPICASDTTQQPFFPVSVKVTGESGCQPGCCCCYPLSHKLHQPQDDDDEGGRYYGDYCTSSLPHFTENNVK